MKKMKVLLAVTGVILIAFVIRNAGTAESAGKGQTPDGVNASGKAVYVMCAEDDRLVVYRGDTVYLRSDTAVSTLPKGDRVRLQQGIVIFSEKELKELMEDYCS